MTDTLTIRLVVLVLGGVALLTVIGGILLALNDKQLPDALVAIGSGAVGAVAALLARTASSTAAPVADNG